MDLLLQNINTGEHLHVEVKAEKFKNEQPTLENIDGVESQATESHIKDNLNEHMNSLLQNVNKVELVKVKAEMFQNDQSQFLNIDCTHFVENTALDFKEEIVNEKYLGYKYSHFQDIDYGHVNTETSLLNATKARQLNAKEEKFDFEKAHYFYNIDSNLQVQENPSMNLNSDLRTFKQEVQVDDNSPENCHPFVKQNNKLFVSESTDVNSLDEYKLDAGKVTGILHLTHEMKDHEERTKEGHVQDKTYLDNVKYHTIVVNSELTNSKTTNVLTTSSKPSSGAGNSLFKSCNIDFDSKIDLPHYCHECGKLFKTSAFLQQHMAKHNTKKTYQCKLCGKAFRTEDKHKRHMTMHESVGPHQVYACGKDGFESVGLPTKHTRTTSQTAKLPYQCTVCRKRFKTMFYLKTHRFKHITEPSHPCVMCGKELKTEREHRVHMLYSHSIERPHQCTLCWKRFMTRSNLRQHMIIHSTEWPYRCNVCDNRYKKIASLQQHLSFHNSDITSICFVCGAGFKTITELRDHANSHSF